MKKTFVILFMMLQSFASVASQACEDTPIIVASAAYTSSNMAIAPGLAFSDADSGIEFVRVAGGCYCMGIVENGTRDAVPSHQVCVDDYYMGKYEVTQAQWRAIMGSNPSEMNSCDNCPVVDVSWREAQEFIRRLTARTGKSYRLPTEAEWEYAVQIGGTQEKNGTMNASSDRKRELRPVGGSQPNSFGIHDMLGSVWEWTNDCYDKNYYKDSPKYNPEGPPDGSYRTLRGGSWDDTQQSIQPTLRAKYEPWIKRSWVGFRLISPDQTSAKFKTPAVLTADENAGQNRQCGPLQQALFR